MGSSSSLAALLTGVVTAGLAIAGQRAVTAFFGYLIIRLSGAFKVGDRVKMGGVQGDVIKLGFFETRILEMGKPPDVNEADTPGVWVRARQYSGRIATVTNDKLFDSAIYNFTRDLPYIWEEVHVGIDYHTDRARAEQILIEAGVAETQAFWEESKASRIHLERKYGITLDAHRPKVYWRLTDDWLELTMRFLVPEHGVRAVKDAITRRILPAFEQAGIDFKSTTFGVTELPPIDIRVPPAQLNR